MRKFKVFDGWCKGLNRGLIPNRQGPGVGGEVAALDTSAVPRRGITEVCV